MPLSILIVTFNNGKDILACLNALLRQKAPFEIILVDNASQDRTRLIVQAFQKKYSHITIQTIWNPLNPGYAHAMNQACHSARGGFILLLGPDTAPRYGAVASLMRFLKNHPGAGAVAPQFVDFEGRIQPSCRRFPTVQDALFELTGLPRLFPARFKPKWKMVDFDHTTQREVEQPETSCLLIRREFVEGGECMDEQFPIFFNDVDLCRRIQQRGKKIIFLPEAKVAHRKGASIRPNRIPMVWKSHQGFYRYFHKYRSAPADWLWNQGLGLLFILTAAWRSFLVLSVNCSREIASSRKKS